VLFTWMIAMQMWATREDHLDPFAGEDDAKPGAQILRMPSLPRDDRALVA
jgi:hypothetical protein